MKALEWTVTQSMAGLRLDQALAQLLPQHSRSRLQTWIRAGHISIDGRVGQSCKLRLCGDEHLCFDIAALTEAETAAKQNTPEAEAIPLQMVYVDDALIVVNKPAGLVTHPGAGNWRGTMQNALLHYAPELASIPRCGIVHRLDKATSGLLVVARTPEAQTSLVRQLQARSVRRLYLAVARGLVRSDGEVNAPIARHPRARTRMAVRTGGKEALTRYRVLEHFPNATLLECSLATGRTHQIRVHLAALGHPLLGDIQYGGKAAVLSHIDRQALHAWQLVLQHPCSGETMRWESEPPEDFTRLLEFLRAG